MMSPTQLPPSWRRRSHKFHFCNCNIGLLIEGTIAYLLYLISLYTLPLLKVLLNRNQSYKKSCNSPSIWLHFTYVFTALVLCDTVWKCRAMEYHRLSAPRCLAFSVFLFFVVVCFSYVHRHSIGQPGVVAYLVVTKNAVVKSRATNRLRCLATVHTVIITVTTKARS